MNPMEAWMAMLTTTDIQAIVTETKSIYQLWGGWKPTTTVNRWSSRPSTNSVLDCTWICKLPLKVGDRTFGNWGLLRRDTNSVVIKDGRIRHLAPTVLTQRQSADQSYRSVVESNLPGPASQTVLCWRALPASVDLQYKLVFRTAANRSLSLP